MKKCTFSFPPSMQQASISRSCNASSRNNDGRNPDFSGNKQRGPENLSSKNGRSNFTSPNSIDKEELRKLFRKYSPLLQEGSENHTVNNNRNYGNYLPKLEQEKLKGKSEAFVALLNLLREKSSTLKKNTNPVPSNNSTGTGTETYISKNFEDKDTGAGTESDTEDEGAGTCTESGGEIESLSLDGVGDFEEDEVPVESATVPAVQTRPPSSFSRRSPIPEVKYEPVVALNARRKEKKKSEDKSEPESESGFFEPVSLDASDDELDSVFQSLGTELEDESTVLGSWKSAEEESVDLGSLKVAELREIAKSRGIKRYSKMKKADLIEQLSSS